jgi:predicted PurR-regulated permease PerM
VTQPAPERQDGPPPLHGPRLAPDADDARFLRRLVYVVLAVALVAALVRAGDLLILAFGSMLGAIVIHAVADLYRDHLRLPRRPALAAAMLSVLATIGLLVWLFAVEFRQQVDVLVEQGPGIVRHYADALGRTPVGAKIVDAVTAAFGGSRVAQDIGGLATGAGELLLNALLCLVGALFFAADPRVYERGFLFLVPPRSRPAAEDALFDVSATLRLWLKAQLIQMTTMGVMVGLGLWAIGVPSAAALGLLTGISEFVPYVGPIAAMLPALGLAAARDPDLVGWTVGVFALVRVVQTNLVTPWVTSRVVAIPPAVTLFAIVAIGYVFGLFGLFFSAALLVVAFTLVRSLYLREMLGVDVPRAAHRTLLGPDLTPVEKSRDSP